MKIVVISDTHRMHNQITVPNGDILVHCGDWTNKGETFAMEEFLTWFSGQPHLQKVFIAGNHELGLDAGPMRKTKQNIIQKYLDKNPNLTYLEQSEAIISGLKFYGSPVSPRFYDWAWNVDRGKAIAQFWEEIPEDVEMLITHGPPYGILDLVDNTFGGRDPHQGCEMLRQRLDKLTKLKLHMFGHLHKQGGSRADVDGKIFVNAAVCTDSYKPTNLPVVVDLD